MDPIENVLIRMQAVKEQPKKFKELDKELARLQNLQNGTDSSIEELITEDMEVVEATPLPTRVRIDRKWHFVKNNEAVCGIAVTGVDYTIKDFNNFDGNPHKITCLTCRDLYKAQR